MRYIQLAIATPTFVFWVQKSIVDVLETNPTVGQTGYVEADFDVYVNDGTNTLASPVSAAAYVITELGRGWYKIVLTTIGAQTEGLGILSIDVDSVDAEPVTRQVVDAAFVIGNAPSDLQKWRGTQPNILQTNRVDVSVGDLQANVISSTAFSSSGRAAIGMLTTGTAQGGAAGSITLAAAAIATDDLVNGLKVGISSGTGAGQARRIRDFVTATQVATVFPNWKTAPDNTSTYYIYYDTGAVEDGGLVSTSFGASSIERVAFAQDARDMFSELRRNTAQAGAAGTITLDAGASAVDDIYNNAKIVIVGGTGAGQFRLVADYVGSSKILSVSENWSTPPDATSVFVIFASVGGAGSSSTVDANVISIDEDASVALVNAIWTHVVESGVSAEQMLRLLVALNGGEVGNFQTGTLVFKGINGTTTRCTVVSDPTGRLSFELGTLT